jgi:hypothetical protein
MIYLVVHQATHGETRGENEDWIVSAPIRRAYGITRKISEKR